MPFFTALLAFLFLKEKVSLNVWIAIIIASIGLVIGITSSVGFSVFSVSLRWRKETPKFTTVAIAGLVCFLVSLAVLYFKGSNFLSSGKNESLFAVHGTL